MILFHQDKSIFKLPRLLILFLALVVGGLGCSGDSDNKTALGLNGINNENKIRPNPSLKFSPINDPTISDAQIGDIAKKATVLILGQASPGSGVLVARDNEKYSVLTAWHVLKDQRDGEEIFIQTFDGNSHKSSFRSIRKIQGVDLALLDFESNKKYQPIKIGDTSVVTPGDQVFVSGFPLQHLLSLRVFLDY